jgi:acetate kinase
MRLLVVNTGSSSLKLKSYQCAGRTLEVEDAASAKLEGDPTTAIAAALARVRRPDAVLHRIVFGGEHRAAVRIDSELGREIVGYRRFAPRHTDVALAAVDAAASFGVPMVAVFDSAFHDTLPQVAKRYAIPGTSFQRHGFHGFAHASLLEQYVAATGRPEPTIVTLQLGAGASACAILRGRSVDTSMGLSTLEGLIMATRSGDLDPAVVLELVESGKSPAEVRAILSLESGLLALGGSQDMQALLERTDEQAALAVEAFCYRAAKYAGAYLAALQGAEAIVMGGGIAEHSPRTRAMILERFAWAGLDVDRNATAGPQLSRGGSRLAAYVFRPDEELVMARMALPLVEELVS